MVVQHFQVRLKGSTGERLLWVRPYISRRIFHDLFVLFRWFYIWEVGGRTPAVLWGVASRILQPLFSGIERERGRILKEPDVMKYVFFFFKYPNFLFFLVATFINQNVVWDNLFNQNYPDDQLGETLIDDFWLKDILISLGSVYLALLQFSLDDSMCIFWPLHCVLVDYFQAVRMSFVLNSLLQISVCAIFFNLQI